MMGPQEQQQEQEQSNKSFINDKEAKEEGKSTNNEAGNFKGAPPDDPQNNNDASIIKENLDKAKEIIKGNDICGAVDHITELRNQGNDSSADICAECYAGYFKTIKDDKVFDSLNGKLKNDIKNNINCEF